MGDQINAMLKQESLNFNIYTLVVHLANNSTKAVNYQSVIQRLEGQGRTILNTRELTSDETKIKSFMKDITVYINDINNKNNKNIPRIKRIPGIKKLPTTLWLECHGASGWLFGKNKNIDDEFKATVAFASFVTAIESDTEISVDKIVLNACFTANELVCEENNTYLISPARMLSILLHDKLILGIVGMNATTHVSDVYHQKNGAFVKVRLNIEDAAILFRNGRAIESFFDSKKPGEELYCLYSRLPDFIKQALQPSVENNNAQPEPYYVTCLAVELIEARLAKEMMVQGYINVMPKCCCGTKQRSIIDKWLAVQNPTFFSVNTDNILPTNTTNRHRAFGL